jgi:hypothetical protein
MAVGPVDRIKGGQTGSNQFLGREPGNHVIKLNGP